jgi:hypothetical protein
LSAVSPALAQDDAAEARPAFSLSTSEVFTTRDAPNFYLTFKRIQHLDFRVYKVRDPFAFFEGLDDPHLLGSGDTRVRQERTWLERFSDWKREQRQYLRRFARAQASHEYRAARRAANDEAEVSQRVVLNASTFAQVPLLNADQVVTTWRELLPRSAARAGRSQTTRHLRRRGGQRPAARLHHRHRLGHRSRHQDIAGTNAVLRRQSLYRRAGQRLHHPRRVREEDDRRRPHQCGRPVRSGSTRLSHGKPDRGGAMR